ncbi:MAG: hypothetical protein KY459_14460 [Acidobacteria bacterium]|nr:hypothetical protein [Acidobacteriota bacterium]
MSSRTESSSERSPIAATAAPARVEYGFASRDRMVPGFGHALGEVRFGGEGPAPGSALRIALPPLGSESGGELLASDRPVREIREGNIRAAVSGGTAFATLQAEPGEDLCSATRRLYGELIDFMRTVGSPHLVRVWNYFPGINENEVIERYQRFCVGRFEAFLEKGFDMDRELPAGSALGSRSGLLSVVALGSSEAPRFIENPRQVSAFHYPGRYGPRSPSFARAALYDAETLFISGTASIVGHETVHVGDVAGQVSETIRNLDAVISEAFGPGAGLGSPGLHPKLKVYVRHASDQPEIASIIEQLVDPASVLYLNAEICRSELLVEIEAFVRRERS